MANTVQLRGHFGIKQSFNVSAATVATGWYAGELFKIASTPTQNSYTENFVEISATSGSAIMGMALENSSDVTTAVAGMTQPSGSKVTLLHGHSDFEIINGAATKCYVDTGVGNVEDASIMDTLYNDNGKWTISAGTDGENFPEAYPIGFVTKVPSASNNYTLGVVLYG